MIYKTNFISNFSYLNIANLNESTMKVCNSRASIYTNILHINTIGIFTILVCTLLPIKNLLLEYRNKKIYRLSFYKYAPKIVKLFSVITNTWMSIYFSYIIQFVKYLVTILTSKTIFSNFLYNTSIKKRI